MKRRITIDGITYTLSTRTYDDYLDLKGPGSHMVGGRTLLGPIDREDIRDRIRDCVASAKECHRNACESLARNMAKE